MRGLHLEKLPLCLCALHGQEMSPMKPRLVFWKFILHDPDVDLQKPGKHLGIYMHAQKYYSHELPPSSPCHILYKIFFDLLVDG